MVKPNASLKYPELAIQADKEEMRSNLADFIQLRKTDASLKSVLRQTQEGRKYDDG